ncbi:HAD family hydrolase [Halorussus marinus]|uniref:HAD family hydrolase n=1 Tax=Halorussus marinus TaxID=2505976 RepID=UPI00106E5A79|nr:HAD family hydrolase [Halorussus marinus]
MTHVAARYDAVVFDNDGVLTHPTDESLLLAASREAFGAFDVDPDAGDVRALVEDLSVETVRELADRYGLDAERFWRRNERHRTAVQASAIREGRKPLYADVDVVADLSVPTAIVSNNQHATIERVVDEFDLATFEAHYGRDPTLEGLARRKPDPSYLETALDALDVRSALYVGDSRVDVAAANAAGVDSAFVARPHRREYRLDAEPTYRIESLADLTDLPARSTDTDSPRRPQ